MTDAIGLLAACLVLATFSMRTMWWLRLTAMGSNIAFIWYGLAMGLLPIWLLHAILLPLNAWRCVRAWKEMPQKGGFAPAERQRSRQA